MITQEVLTYMLGISAIISIVLSVWTTIRKPQEKSELSDAVFSTKFDSLEKIVVNLRDNHLHTISERLDTHIKEQSKNELLVCEKLARIETKLETILKHKL